MQKSAGIVAGVRARPKMAIVIGCAVLVLLFCLCGAINIVLNPSLLNTSTPRPTVPSPTATITRTTAPTATDKPTRTPRPTKTPTATASPRPTRTATPIPPPTSSGPKNYDKNGDGKVTCDDFNFQFQAQEAYDAGYTDLDGNPKNGRACESLP